MAISNNSTGLRPGVCTSTTRPTAPYEGQMIYETDTDMVAIWNGSAWRYLAATTPTNGTVLQTVYDTGTGALQNATATFADTGLSASITPKSTSSKILIYVSMPCAKTSTNSGSAVNLRILRDSTTITTSYANLYSGTAITVVGTIPLLYLDSPSTTSATTYKVQYANFISASLAEVQGNGSDSYMILQEIAA